MTVKTLRLRNEIKDLIPTLRANGEGVACSYAIYSTKPLQKMYLQISTEERGTEVSFIALIPWRMLG